MTIAFLIIAIVALIVLYRFVQNHADSEIHKVKELRRIVDHLDGIKRSIDWATGEVTGPILADLRTELNAISRQRR